MSKSIALVGNPNCGKTTVFNRLTGGHQRIGNWPGVTVEQHNGRYKDPSSHETVQVIDLPGCYSLVATADMALDEKVACDYILNAQDTIYINVIDAAHLSRDLYLSMQLLEMGVPMIVALNCLDLAAASGIAIDIEALTVQLGCPVIPMIAKKGSGIKQLKEAVSNFKPRANYQLYFPNVFQATLQSWQQYANPGQILRALEGDVLIESKLNAAEINVVAARAELARQLELPLDVYVAKYRRSLIAQTLKDVVTTQRESKASFSERVDNIVLHKVAGPVIFLSVMYLMFTFAINLGGIFQVHFEELSEAFFVNGVQNWLTNLGVFPWLINFIAEGIGRGISITLTFTPVLTAMFLCLGILESTGYMTRAAFIVDRIMSYLGLSGKSFVPMIVGFGCNVPAVMGARTLATPGERILTILMTPFMSCSARLAIYAIFVAAFFPLGGQNIIFSLYLIGIAVAVLTGLALRDAVIPRNESISVMEMPDYRWPMFSSLMRQVWHRLKSFLVKAGIFIVILCLLINGLGNDMLASVGKFLTPLFAPIGISPENWPATVGLLTGLIAKEAVVGTLNAFYASERAMVESFGGAIPAYAYLLFTLLYFPCVSVVAAISKELNFKWALFSVVWSTGLAYIIAALFYQTATLNSWLWIISLSSLLIGFFFSARWLVTQQQKRVARRKLVPTAVNLLQD